MAFSSSSLSQARYLKESTWGTTPAGRPIELRMTQETLAFALKKDSSKELTASRMVKSTSVMDADTTGAINFDFSYAEYDEFIAGTMQKEWVGVDGVRTAAVATAGTFSGGNTFTGTGAFASVTVPVNSFVEIRGSSVAANNGFFRVLTSGAGTFTTSAVTNVVDANVTVIYQGSGLVPVAPTVTVTASAVSAGAQTLTFSAATANLANLTAGQWVRIAGMSAVANNGLFKVVSASTTVLVLNSGTTTPVNAVTAAAGAIRVYALKLNNGTTDSVPPSYSLEVQHSDTGNFFMYTGMQPSKMSLKVSSGSFINGSFDFIGKNSTTDTSSIFPSGISAVIPSQSYEVMSSVASNDQFLVDGVSISGAPLNSYVKEFSFDYDNKLQGLKAVANLGNVGVLNGQAELKGSMMVYLSNASLYTDFINSIKHGITAILRDSTGVGYVVDFPNCDLSDVKRNNGSLDQPVMLDINFTVLQDTSSGRYLTIHKI